MSESISGNTYGFDGLNTNQVAVIQAAAAPVTPLDFSVGSILLAIVEGTSWVGLWLQGLILQVLTLTRAATSNGSDLDSWMADFAFPRIPGNFATGVETFSRYTPTSTAVVPVGAAVVSADGTQTFLVITDTTQPTWNPAAGNYQIPAGTSSATITVRNTVAGTAGNVAAGLVTTLQTPISGVDTVTNVSAMGGGTQPESDAAYRTRFQAYVQTRDQVTTAGILSAAEGVAGVVSATLTQNYDYSGAYDPGSLYVVIDDGSGDPPGTLVSSVLTAVGAAVAGGIRFAAFGSTTVTANVACTLTAASGYTHSAVAPIVSAAISAYINALPLGATLYYANLVTAATNSSPGVGSLTGFTVNSGTADITATNKQVIRPGTVTVS